MSGRRRVKIHAYDKTSLYKRLLDEFFKVDGYWVSYELYPKEDVAESDTKEESAQEQRAETDKRLANVSAEMLEWRPQVPPEQGMSEYVPRLNFERGDAVGVLLFNTDTRSVVLVEQFKLPTLVGRRRDEAGTQHGWIVEVMAGMIRPDETAEDSAIRETLEETGYIIESPTLICKFLSSPGGTSERIYLYFAKVTDAKRLKKGQYGVDDENIRVLELDVNKLFDMLERGQLDDPKLAIATYWLKDHMDVVEDLDEQRTVKFQVNGTNGIVGYKTGSIEGATDVHAWVNPENTMMMMDRFMGKSISAKIRYLGSNRSDEDDSVIEDTIQESLRGAVGEGGHVRLGTVLVTEPGMLGDTHKVKLLCHVAAAEGGLGEGATVRASNLKSFVKKVLACVDRENDRFWRKFRKDNIDSVIFPMIGAGEEGVPVEVSGNEIIPAAIKYFKDTPETTIKEIYFSAFKLRDKSACDAALKKCCDDNLITRLRD